MKKLFTLTVFICLSCMCFSQRQIKGRVIDKLSREPLELAHIETYKGSVVSDRQGNFTLTILSPDIASSAIISFIGYTSQRINLDKEYVLVELEKGAVNMEEVVVSSASPGDAFHAISKIDLNLQPVRSAQDMMRLVPGLFIGQHQGGGKAEQIFLRGFDIDHGTDVNVSVDGLPVNMVSHAHGQGYADLHFLIPELVDNIDYGKGPYYSTFGNMGTAGYVNLSTANSIDGNMLKVEAGQFNTIRSVAMFNLLGKRLKDNGTNAYIASEFLYSDGPFKSAQHFNRFNIFGKLNTYFGKKNRFTFIASALNSDWDASGQVPGRAVRSGLIDRFGFIDDTEGGYTSRINASAKLNTYLKGNSTWENQLYYSRYHFNLHSNFTFFLNDPVNGDQIRQREGRNIFGYHSRLLHQVDLGNWKLHSVYGAGLRLDKTQNSELSHTINRNTMLRYAQLGDISELNAFAYTDETIENGKWLFNVGARIDHFKFDYNDKLQSVQQASQQKTIFSPKINVQYSINKRAQLYLKTGKGFHSNDARVVVFNRGEEILPAAYGADAGIVVKPTPKLLVNAALWYLYLQQEFVYVGDEGIIEPSGKTRRTGIDVSARYQFNSWLYADANLNLAKPRSIDDPKGENYIPLAPSLTSTGGVTWQMKNGFNGSLRYRYIKDRPAIEDNSVIAKGYTVTDLSFNYTRKRYELGFVVENLFNVEWNETQFNTESRLRNEIEPVEEIHFTPGVPFFSRVKLSVFF